jgi:choline dehydrogenase-like flavoprotein
MSSFDCIIVGAGPSDIVVAARLKQKISSASILLLEAGKDEAGFELAKHIKYIGPVRGSRIDWNFDTVPQVHLDGKPIKKAFAGYALSGGGALSVGGWTRGLVMCYDW